MLPLLMAAGPLLSGVMGALGGGKKEGDGAPAAGPGGTSSSAKALAASSGFSGTFSFGNNILGSDNTVTQRAESSGTVGGADAKATATATGAPPPGSTAAAGEMSTGDNKMLFIVGGAAAFLIIIVLLITRK